MPIIPSKAGGMPPDWPTKAGQGACPLIGPLRQGRGMPPDWPTRVGQGACPLIGPLG